MGNRKQFHYTGGFAVIFLLLSFCSYAQFGGIGSPGVWLPSVVSTQTITAVFTKTVSGTNPTSAAVNASASSEVFVGVGYKKVATAVTISDNGGHTWNQLIQKEGTNTNESGSIVYETHGTFSSSFTVTVTCNTCAVSVNGFAGTTATSVDQTNGVYNGTATTSDATGPITTTRSHNVVMSVIYNSGGTNTPTLPTGFTDAGVFPFGTTFPSRVCYKINNSGTSTENATYTFSAAGGNDALVICDE